GFVFQEPTLMPWATVFANVHLPLRLAGIPPAKGRPAGLGPPPPGGLAALAECIPPDRRGARKSPGPSPAPLAPQPNPRRWAGPSAALDEITRFGLNDALLALWQALGKTVVFVTHSVFESVSLSSRIVVMTPRPGRVHAELRIDAPYPRDASFRTSAQYAGLCRLASEALAGAMARAEGGAT